MGPEFLWIFLTFTISSTFAESCKRESRCKISRVHRMKGADCFDQDLRTIPQCLASDVEILELTRNRLRKIDRNDLKRYSSLKVLYLSDNVISRIHTEAFEGMDELMTLDLSLNSLFNVPEVIFQLPSLKNLYLGQNMNINVADTVEQLKSISSPLVSFDISYISDELQAMFPDLGIVPTLIRMNISGTDFEYITPKHLAGLCSLKYLININTTTNFKERCDCWRINRWLRERKVEFVPFDCDEDTDCDAEISPEDKKQFEECQKLLSVIETNKKLSKGLMYGGIAGGIVILCILLYFLYKCTNRIKPKPKKLEKSSTTLL